VARGEDAAPDPTFDYGLWKARAELIVAGRSASNAIVRPSLVVSVDPDDAAVARIRAHASRGETTTWFDDELRQPAMAADLAAALWRIASLDRTARSGVWHLPGPETLSRYELARRTVDVLDLDPALVASEPSPPDSGRPRHLELSDDRARSQIDWAPEPVLRRAGRGRPSRG
jgi:dTDP-4-dehydrorhamnose reductase